MKLYYDETSNGRLACAVVRHLDLPVDYIRVNLAKGEQRKPDYLALNPNGKIPTLVDGDLVLWEAPAIICHLACKAGSDLYPADDRTRIEILRWIHWNTAHFSRHAGNLYFERLVKPALGLGEPDPAEIEGSSRYLKQFAAVLDDHLRGRDYLVGERLSVADFAVGKYLVWAEPAALPLQGLDEIRRWYAQLEALPAWRKPYPTGETEAAAAQPAAA